VNNWKVICAAVVIFGSGVITGGLLVNHIQSSPTVLAGRNPVIVPAVSTNETGHPIAKSLRQPVIVSKDFLQRLDKELGLSPEQFEAIQKIINESQSMIRKTIQGSRLEIREVLTPDQRSQFDDMFQRQAKRPAPGTNQPPAAMSGTTNAP
jgi:hypothetical protein